MQAHSLRSSWAEAQDWALLHPLGLGLILWKSLHARFFTQTGSCLDGTTDVISVTRNRIR